MFIFPPSRVAGTHPSSLHSFFLSLSLPPLSVSLSFPPSFLPSLSLSLSLPPPPLFSWCGPIPKSWAVGPTDAQSSEDGRTQMEKTRMHSTWSATTDRGEEWTITVVPIEWLYQPMTPWRNGLSINQLYGGLILGVTLYYMYMVSFIWSVRG